MADSGILAIPLRAQHMYLLLYDRQEQHQREGVRAAVEGVVEEGSDRFEYGVW